MPSPTRTRTRRRKLVVPRVRRSGGGDDCRHAASVVVVVVEDDVIFFNRRFPRMILPPFWKLLFVIVAAVVVHSIVLTTNAAVAVDVDVEAALDFTTGGDGKFCLLSFVPFTRKGMVDFSFLEDGKNTTTNRRRNVGFSHMAAGLLAMDHFNNRDGSVVPELQSDPFLRDECNFQFDWNSSRVFDSQIAGKHAVREIQNYLLQEGGGGAGRRRRCAIAGPFSDYVANDLSVLASSIESPIVLYRNTNINLAINVFSPFSTQANPLTANNVQFLYDFLLEKRRSDYVAVLYQIESPDSNQQHEALKRIFEASGSQVVAQGFTEFQANFVDEELLQQNNIFAALSRIKSSGNFRTIVVIINFINVDAILPKLAEAADELDMNTGEHVWVFFGSVFLPTLFSSNEMLQNEKVIKLLQGAVLLDNVDAFTVDGDDDPFYQSWRRQGKEMVDSLNRLNPVQESDPGYIFAEDDYFQTQDPALYAGYFYDTVMSIGIGACLATKMNESDGLSGLDHLKGIQASNFTGATGNAWFSPSFFAGNNVRDSRASLFGAFNILPPGNDELYVLTDLRDPLNYSRTVSSNTRPVWDPERETYRYPWTPIQEFVYRNGSTEAPYLLRDPPEANFLNRSARIFGLALFVIITLVIIAASIWIVLNRGHAVLRAAQPHFLLPICVGAQLQAVCIVFISFDESYGTSVETLSRLCVAIPWCFVVGGVTISSSIFAKLLRVHTVLQFARRKVPVWTVAVPAFLLLAACVVLLAVWTGTSVFGWVRTVVDPATSESFGQCDGDGSNELRNWFLCIFLVGFVPEVLTLVMAYKTRDVDDVYAESSWIFVMALVQFQAMLVGFPLVFLLRDSSTTGRYIGMTLLIAVFSASSVLFIMVPKVMAFYGLNSTGKKRGERPGVRISGMNNSQELTSSSRLQRRRGSQSDDDIISQLSLSGDKCPSSSAFYERESSGRPTSNQRPESIDEAEEVYLK